MDTASLTALLDELAGVLAECGLHAGLRYLNARTRHRFTGVYRFDPPMLRNLCLFDRENPTLRFGGDTPMRETYCSLVGAKVSPFATPDAAADGRLLDHPARLSVLAYCGVPLVDDQGSCFGSLCHFDVRPRLVPADEVPLLERAAPLVLRACGAAAAARRDAGSSVARAGERPQRRA
jgi:GAF domain-containing protein